MKKRRNLSLLITLLLIIGVLSACSEDTSLGSSSSDSSSSSSSKSTSSSTTPKKSTNNSTMTKAEFNKIKDGMSYKQVASIIGGKGTIESETGNSGDSDHTIIYTWNGDGSLGANASVTFQGDKVINKAQFGVDNGSDAKITIQKFNKIKNGMTYEEVQKIVGGKGSIDSETGKKGQPDHTVMISYEGTSIGANAIFTFQGEKLINKSQAGLK